VWEIGRCFAAIHRAGFLWGTFCDHTQDRLHCNAHMDNFVVAPRSIGLKSEKEYQLLAPLDFDMAFAKEQAVSIWSEPAVPDPTMVTLQFSAEFHNLLDDLGGIRGCVEGVSLPQEPRPQPVGEPDRLLWVARDVASWEFVMAYQAPMVDRSEAIGLPGSAAFDLVEKIIQYTKDEES
jgi:hypothetical protein